MNLGIEGGDVGVDGIEFLFGGDGLLVGVVEGRFERGFGGVAVFLHVGEGFGRVSQFANLYFAGVSTRLGLVSARLLAVRVGGLLRLDESEADGGFTIVFTECPAGDRLGSVGVEVAVASATDF